MSDSGAEAWPDPDPSLIEEARQLVQASRAIVALTGAGISTEAGIPDFRGPQGVWTRNPAAERLSTLQNYLRDPDIRRTAWQTRLDSPLWRASPTAGHLALVDLERTGRLHTIVTQNIDGLHIAAGSDAAKVIEIHGSSLTTLCWSCKDRQPTADVLERVRAGEQDPPCLLCGGILKTATISFGQSLDGRDLRRAQDAAFAADLLIAVGTTLEVQPVAGMVPLAKVTGARIIIVNAEPTAGDAVADVVLRGRIGDILPELVRP